MKNFNMEKVNDSTMFVIALINLILSIFNVPERLGMNNFASGVLYVFTIWCFVNVIFKIINTKREEKAFKSFMKDFETMLDEVKQEIAIEEKKKKEKKEDVK